MDQRADEMKGRPRHGLTWNPAISAGSVLAALSMLISGISSGFIVWYGMEKRLTKVEGSAARIEAVIEQLGQTTVLLQRNQDRLQVLVDERTKRNL